MRPVDHPPPARTSHCFPPDNVEESWGPSGHTPAALPSLPCHSFEAACTGQPVADASSEYGALLRAQLGGLRVYLGAEIDCFDPATCAGVCGTQPPGLASYLELKTYRWAVPLVLGRRVLTAASLLLC